MKINFDSTTRQCTHQYISQLLHEQDVHKAVTIGKFIALHKGPIPPACISAATHARRVQQQFLHKTKPVTTQLSYHNAADREPNKRMRQILGVRITLFLLLFTNIYII